jgi:probable HAF family extracellular repeat protein
VQDLGSLGGDIGFVAGINNSGQITGAFENGSGYVHAFRYSGGAMHDLGALVSGGESAAFGINDSGQVVGWADSSDYFHPHAFLCTGDTMYDLGTLSGAEGSESRAWAINNSGQIVGEATAAGGAHAFLYSNATMQDLGTLASPYNFDSSANGINDSGQVVGSATTSSYVFHAFLYSNGTMEDLNSLIASASGWTLSKAGAINDSGQIVVGGYNPSGQYDAFLLTPAIPGDANLDGSVDVNDLTIVLSHYNQTGMTWTDGEFTGDGTVDINDLTILLTNFGKSLGSSAADMAAAPEPPAFVLAGFAAIGLLALALLDNSRGLTAPGEAASGQTDEST